MPIGTHQKLLKRGTGMGKLREANSVSNAVYNNKPPYYFNHLMQD